MKKEFKASNAKFIYTRNDLAFEEVLDRFDTAKEIYIVTFNISARNNSLVNALKKVSDCCEINVITNIPSRWEMYYKERFRENAEKNINLYLTKLNPESIGSKISVFFNFSNHGKIIMTDTIAYIGSANYSEESADNTEFGFIIDDKDFIEYIKTDVIKDLQEQSTPYYEYDYTPLLLEANVALSAVFNIINILYDEVYRFHDDIDGKWTYYVDTEATLTVDTLDKIVEIVKEACNIAGDIYDAIDVVSNFDEDETISASDAYDELWNIELIIEDLSCRDSIIELSEFDTNEFINEQLQNNYSLEAYDEYLEKYIGFASEDAMCKVMDLTAAAKDDVDKLLDRLMQFCVKYADFIEKLSKKKYKKINPNIDNTK